jgi:Flp pilus assembly protein TadG
MLELALCIPLLLLILFGTMDLGRMFYTGITLSGAALAGTQYGVFSVAHNTDFTGMQQAALNDSANISGVTATATSYCECLDGTAVSCSTGLCGGKPPPTYVKVITTATFSTLFSYPYVPSSAALSGLSVQRAQ